MALQYPPSTGDVLVCVFPDCFEPPEMVKSRPVIVLSPNRMNRGGLVTVVPVSMTEPTDPQPWHCEIPKGFMPQPYQHTPGTRWAKCDMLYTLRTERLELAQGPRNRTTGKRGYFKGKLDIPTLQAVQLCVARSLGVRAELFKEELRPDLFAEFEAQQLLAQVAAAADQLVDRQGSAETPADP